MTISVKLIATITVLFTFFRSYFNKKWNQLQCENTFNLIHWLT